MSEGVPTMNFRADDLLKKDRFKHGPSIVYWGEQEIIPPSKEIPDKGAPKRKLRHRLTGRKLWTIDIRLRPLAEVPLDEFGAELAKRAGLEIAPSNDEKDRAIWLRGYSFNRNAPAALAGCGRLFRVKFDGLRISAAQIAVSTPERPAFVEVPEAA